MPLLILIRHYWLHIDTLDAIIIIIRYYILILLLFSYCDYCHYYWYWLAAISHWCHYAIAIDIIADIIDYYAITPLTLLIIRHWHYLRHYIIIAITYYAIRYYWYYWYFIIIAITPLITLFSLLFHYWLYYFDYYCHYLHYYDIDTLILTAITFRHIL
jgi:hypothetical protein